MNLREAAICDHCEEVCEVEDMKRIRCSSLCSVCAEFDIEQFGEDKDYDE